MQVTQGGNQGMNSQAKRIIVAVLLADLISALRI
jgi:hypothetical protein